MSGYTWTRADTPEGRERLKELLGSMGSPDFVVGALSYKQGERFVCCIWPGNVEHARYSLEGFLGEAIPIKEFLDPSPRLEPRPLEWNHLEMGEEATSTSGKWTFFAWRDGTWEIMHNTHLMGCNHEGDGNFDTAKAGIHEWRINHLKSML